MVTANDNSKRHHWWPISLYRDYWPDTDGNINIVEPSGKIKSLSSRNKNIGAQRHAHTLRSEVRGEDGVVYWPELKFEDEFERCDQNIHKLIDWLTSVEDQSRDAEYFTSNKYSNVIRGMKSRVTMMAETASSLITRSPSFRARIEKVVWDNDPKSIRPNPTVNSNIKDAFAFITQNLSNASLKFVFYAKESEFIFGDGFYHDFNASILVARGHLRQACVIPLTPKIALGFQGWFSGAGGFRPIVLAKGEVEEINMGTQIYAKRRLFFRNICPRLLDDFKIGEHMILKHHQHPFFERLKRGFL